jgi:hypothetical protein
MTLYKPLQAWHYQIFKTIQFYLILACFLSTEWIYFYFWVNNNLDQPLQLDWRDISQFEEIKKMSISFDNYFSKFWQPVLSSNCTLYNAVINNQSQMILYTYIQQHLMLITKKK